jgi:hypothetical protein
MKAAKFRRELCVKYKEAILLVHCREAMCIQSCSLAAAVALSSLGILLVNGSTYHNTVVNLIFIQKAEKLRRSFLEKNINRDFQNSPCS